MSTVLSDGSRIATPEHERASTESRHERWAHCHVNWTAVWVGALSTFALVLVLGLIGVALGVHQFGPEHRWADLRKLGIAATVFGIFAAFLSAVAGGWIAGKIAGILHSEPAMLHGAITWVVTVPLLLGASALGANGAFGGWYAGIGRDYASAERMPFVRPEPPAAPATADELAAYRTAQTEYQHNVQQWREETPRATRNAALATVTALLLGLLGGVVGGWMACGEPMTFSHFRTRRPIYHVG